MSILFDKEQQIFNLNTSESTYQIKIDEYGSALHSYYGSKIDLVDYSYLISYGDRGFSGNPSDVRPRRDYSFDWLPQEYSVHGNGDNRITALEITRADGSKSLDLRYFEHSIVKGKSELNGLPSTFADEEDAETLVLTLKDRFENFFVDLIYTVFNNLPVMSRSTRLRNATDETIIINRVASANLDFLYANDFELIHLHGRHNKERLKELSEISHGIFQISSNRGASSHQHNPFSILKSKFSNEDFGECFAFNLIYSGGFNFSFEKDQFDNLRVLLGLDDSSFYWNLQAGAEFNTPELLLTYSDCGLSKLTQSIHAVVNRHLIRSVWKNKKRPIVINNWEATYFDFDDKKILDIAEEAAKIGIDMLVLDDGWFGQRDSDTEGLGDWAVNEIKINGSLETLVERVNALGIDFGIWFEPEMISERSKLYETHPDWVMIEPNREPIFSRSQLVLDFSREEVCEYMENSLKKILDSANIKYVKWDMNRSIANAFSNKLNSSAQGEVRHRYIMGVYRVLEFLHRNYPEILVEGCSGGGGRFDLGMLYYTPQIWTSDNSDAIDRTMIQYGTAFAYPVSSISAHVSTVPNHQTSRITPLKTRGVTAMQGAFGYELDLSLLSETELSEMRKQIEFYNKHWKLIQSGKYFRLNDATDDNLNFNAWSFVSEEQDKALLMLAFKDLQANYIHPRIKFKGLNPNFIYRVEIEDEFKLELKGRELMNGGLLLDFPVGNYDSTYIFVERV